VLNRLRDDSSGCRASTPVTGGEPWWAREGPSPKLSWTDGRNGVNIAPHREPVDPEKEGGEMRRLLIAGALGFMVLSLLACDRSTEDPALAKILQENSDRYEIDQIERKFHEATTLKDVDLMMSLWAPNATFTVGPGATASGVDEIREFWLTKASTFRKDTTWVSDHPAYKVEITVNGDRGTLHFECHYIDYKTGEIAYTTVADFDVARIDGQWLITNGIAGTTELTP